VYTRANPDAKGSTVWEGFGKKGKTNSPELRFNVWKRSEEKNIKIFLKPKTPRHVISLCE
jgi:hypothetical protein